MGAPFRSPGLRYLKRIRNETRHSGARGSVCQPHDGTGNQLFSPTGGIFRCQRPALNRTKDAGASVTYVPVENQSLQLLAVRTIDRSDFRVDTEQFTQHFQVPFHRVSLGGRLKPNAKHGMTSHCANGVNPVPNQGRVGIHSVYAHDFRTTVATYSLPMVYMIPKAMAAVATAENRRSGQCSSPTIASAPTNTTVAITISPMVQCTVARTSETNDSLRHNV